MHKQGIIQAFLAPAAFVLTAPFVISILSLCGLAVLDGLRSAGIDVPLPVLLSFDGPHFAVTYLFADPVRYLIFSLPALVLLFGWLILLAIRSRRNLLRRPEFHFLAFGIVCVLGFAWFPSYEPAVRPAPNVQLQMVEQPDLLMSIVRRNQVSAEIEGCAFETLGWADGNTLVYRKWCGGFYDSSNHYAWKDGTPMPPRAYRADTLTDFPYTGNLQALSRETCAYSSCVRPLLDKDYMHTFSPSPRYPTVANDSVLSPDGKWVAFKAKHVYGPEDLLVVGQPKRE